MYGFEYTLEIGCFPHLHLSSLQSPSVMIRQVEEQDYFAFCFSTEGQAISQAAPQLLHGYNLSWFTVSKSN